MIFRLLIAVILIAQSVFSASPRDDSVRTVRIINRARNVYNLPHVSYNYTLEDDLVKFNKSIDWYYTTSKNYSHFHVLTNGTRRWQGDFILNLPEFTKYRKDGWEWIFRDRTFRSIPYIMGFRVQQKNCINFNNCDKDTFYDYMTCVKGRIINWPYDQCSWAYQYYPKMIQKKLEQIACIKLYPSGNSTVYGNSGDNKNMAFFCYAKYSSPITSDYPL